MLKNKFYKDTFKLMVVISLIMILCRITLGGAAVLVVVAGVVAALTRKWGVVGICYVLIPTFTIFNRAIVGISSVFLMTARLGNLIIILVMLVTSGMISGKSRDKLPLGWLFVYCVVACLSSLDGWMPLISYLKIFQFVFFLMGLYFVTRALQQSDSSLYQIRCAMMALAVIFIAGSFVSRFVPSIGYSMTIDKMAVYGLEMSAEDIRASEKMMLFNGMTCHSQMLAPTVSLMVSWVICDMLLIERGVRILHAVIIAISPALLFFSRSRGGILEFAAVMGAVLVFCVPRARLPQALKSKLFKFMLLACLAMLGAAVVVQIRDQSISKWLRKTDDVGGDTRSLTEAFTGSRQALIEYNLSDFRLNPILGKGFQVMRGMEQAYRIGKVTWYSASVEKGVTPVVILGETGLIGAAVFMAFLISFYATCLRRRYLALFTTFTCVLVANLADSTLFSPGGSGGFDWVVAGVGGFSIDLLAARMAHSGMVPGMGGVMPMPPPHMLGRPMRMG